MPLKKNNQISADNFSEKEIAIIKLLISKKMIEEIASEVDLSPRTVSAIIDKLKTKTKTNSVQGMLDVASKKLNLQ